MNKPLLDNASEVSASGRNFVSQRLLGALLAVTASACASATGGVVVAPIVQKTDIVEEELPQYPAFFEENLMSAVRSFVKKRTEEAIAGGSKNLRNYFLNCEKGPNPSYASEMAIFNAEKYWAKHLNTEVDRVVIKVIRSMVANNISYGSGYPVPAIVCLATIGDKISRGMEI